MEKGALIFLLQKQIAGRISESEKRDLTAFINKTQNKELIVSALQDQLSKQTPVSEFDEKRLIPLLTPIFRTDTVIEYDKARAGSRFGIGKLLNLKKGWWVVFALLIAGAIGAYFYQNPALLKNPAANNNIPLSSEVAPGGNKGILTLSDGSAIVLDSVSKGSLTQQGNAKLTKEDNGLLRYKTSGEANSTLLINTMTTPRGGQYQLLLSDGSRVKLNAVSSITYPAAFSGKERNVTITGEVYFEVAKNAKMPFKVKVYDMEVEALGTHFNINAYKDESSIKTTSISGNVKLTKNTVSSVLQPSQQGQFDNEGNFSLEKSIDTNEVVAWKNGLFEFNNADIKSVMRQIGRWYDLDVKYENGSAADREIFGEIRRDVSISKVLKLLEKNDIHCIIEGKTLVVLPDK